MISSGSEVVAPEHRSSVLLDVSGRLACLASRQRERPQRHRALHSTPRISLLPKIPSPAAAARRFENLFLFLLISFGFIFTL